METRTLYDRNAESWRRIRPTSLSDFTGRPPVFELCGPVAGDRVLDLGCGEGYCSRAMAAAGATRVTGFDISAGMIELARKQEAQEPMGIEYHEGDVTALNVPDASFDLVLGVFVFSYLELAPTVRAFREARRVLAPGGRFVFAVPHPSLAFVRPQEPPFYFDTEGRGYFSARDFQCRGEIARVDGGSLPVQMVHKTMQDYFDALAEAGFRALPTLRELRVTEDHLAIHPEIFGPLVDMPLHLAMRVEGQ